MVSQSPVSGASTVAPAPRSPFSSLASDLPAGLVVFLVALPLCLGIALASNAPLLSGIIAGMVGGLIVSMLSGSQLSVSGPAAGLTAIIVTAIQTLGSFEALLAAVVIAGAVQVLLGVFRAGFVALYFPSSVIRGMLAAIGLILILKQIPHFLGADTDYFEDMTFLQFNGQNTFSAIQSALNAISPGSALIGLFSLGLLLLWDNVLVKKVKTLRLVPAALVVVILSILINMVLDTAAPTLRIRPEHLVQLPRITSLNDFLNTFTAPDWSAFMRPATYTVGLTIAIVASLESLLSVEAVDKLDPHNRVTPPNRELLAQGLGNMVSGVLGGLPLTAVIVRSSANINAGAQTRLSAFVHGLLLLVSLLFLGPLLNRIPLSALAAVLLVVGFRLTRPMLYRNQFQLGWQQFLPFIITVLAILFTDLLKGVTIGLVVGIFFVLKANYEQAFFLSAATTPHQPDTIYLKLAEQVSFLNKASIVKVLTELPDNAHVVIDGSNSASIDYDVLEVIENFRLAAPDRGIRLELVDVPQVAVLGH
ncbi:SulP family inorganic anion transporter [Hymenobacter guriensis]|uniref:SulP family inorganic anion transporter n=1 Tax=Hymenobacter guriensis TaxID=2793065 RepID=A0ABS0L720_9BACT|nr:SulP family inorganic anion transporter [Hymenobacter guriensis]MBG8555920.1 SulP family inorganic anion transporter [Hymenobacter guriensis]